MKRSFWFGTPDAMKGAWRRRGQHLLKISIQENDDAIEFILEGRVAGPWVEELNQAWVQTSARLDGRKLSVDLRNVTYSDAIGKALLREIVARTHAELVTSSAWSQYLADEIRTTKQTQDQEAKRGSNLASRG